jgi:Arc/MetJ family transcription regulator
MATNLSIDPELLAEAWKIGGFSTKKDTVNIENEDIHQQ